ncbi:hypothetical protein [Candidatus Chloroploca asiatica]|uniref:Uncharacterized protein n=1 Tax=Candidatus Chloroploca asiatica TaxID=1506545 RepID=A0A2H3KHQ1_9CHLR|nr:hypothetical protein [Candidatus Chloroploca asiatica]PDV97319.1 hypothetical protein A9Q02_22530 [Candidatus Chloroploca asiatica]
MRVPSQLDVGPFTLHLDVLAARLQRQRHRLRQGLQAGGVVSVLAVVVWLLMPVLRGSGTLLVPPLPPEVQVQLADRPVRPGRIVLPSGPHALHFTQPGAFPVTSVIQVSRQQTTTLIVPPMRPIPLVQPVPLPHPQSTWLQVSPDAGSGWRLTATRPEPERPAGAPGWGPPQPEPAPYHLHLDAQGLTRLPVLETYAIADELTTRDGARFWAVWEPHRGAPLPSVAGSLTLTRPTGTQVITTSRSLRGVWWSPGGRHLLVAVPHAQDVDVLVVDPARPQVDAQVPLITVPGTIHHLAWSPDGAAAVIITSLASPSPPHVARPTPPADAPPTATALLDHTAVLIQFAPPGADARATRLRVPPARPAGLIPLAWTADALWWVTDTGLGLALDRVTLAAGVTERVGPLPDDLVALTVRPDGTLRIVRPTAEGTLAVQRWPADADATLVVLPTIQTQGRTGGIWQGHELLLATGPTALWYVQIQPEALQ